MEPKKSFQGSWKLDKSRSDKPEAQLRELGVGWLRRKAAQVARPTVTVSLEGGREAGGIGSMRWDEEIVAGKFFKVTWTQKILQNHCPAQSLDP